MVKDKTEIIIPTIRIRKSREIPIIIAVIFIGLFIWQCNSTGDFKKENKELLREEERLNDIIADNDKRIEQDSIIIVTQRFLADSLKVSDSIHKKDLNSMNIKYEKLKINYNSATSDDKWDIFTRSLHN